MFFISPWPPLKKHIQTRLLGSTHYRFAACFCSLLQQSCSCMLALSMAAFIAQLNKFDRDHTAQKAENIYYLAFRKSLLTRAVDSIFKTKLIVIFLLETFQGCFHNSKLIFIERYFPIIF